jgi:hypothetical protein
LDGDDCSTGGRGGGATALAHLPNLDMGGKCAPGCALLLKAVRDRRGRRVEATAVSPKYGTPKCEYIAQLLYVDDHRSVTTATSTSASMAPPVQ